MWVCGHRTMSLNQFSSSIRYHSTHHVSLRWGNRRSSNGCSSKESNRRRLAGNTYVFGDRCFFPSSAHGHFQSIHYAIFFAQNMNTTATEQTLASKTLDGFPTALD
ncbi:hypothetical protein NXC14_PC00783 (plasmid) [Rhizobium sp. NXC14]|nr:hypothetical protein NXC14_PC00783 [Rhizobium sp. NXC14]